MLLVFFFFFFLTKKTLFSLCFVMGFWFGSVKGVRCCAWAIFGKRKEGLFFNLSRPHGLTSMGV